MQAWERDLMWASADLLCQHGREFYEVGLGLGISALRIANNPTTRQHTVLELFPKVEELFRRKNPELPTTLRIEHGDFFEKVFELETESIDGMFFDPALDMEVWKDEELWPGVVPEIVRALRPGECSFPSSVLNRNCAGNTYRTSERSEWSGTVTRPMKPPSTRTASQVMRSFSVSTRTDQCFRGVNSSRRRTTGKV